MPDPETQSGQTEYKVLWNRILERAHTDRAFRQQLLSQPRQALREAGIEVPEDMNVTFHELDPNDQHIILPSTDSQLVRPPVTRYGMGKQRGGENNG